MATDQLPPKIGKKQNSKDNNPPVFDRELPFNLEAEIGVLGSMVLLPDTCDDVINICHADDFYDPAHQCLFQHIVEMHTSGHKFDITLLRERLISCDDYEKVGGAAYLAKIFTAVANAAHAAYYAKIVHEKSLTRNIIHTCHSILDRAYEQNVNSDTKLTFAEQEIFSIGEKRQTNTLVEAKTAMHLALDRFDQRMQGHQIEGTIDTGFTDLDKLTGGLHASELVILAARPSMGKTAFAMNIAEFVSIQTRLPVLFVSLEMSAIELIERLLCSLAKVNGHRLRNGSLSADEQKRFVDSATQNSDAPLLIDDSPSRTVAQIAATARRIKKQRSGLGLIVVDYLQLIEPDNSSDPRQEQVAKIARRLKGLARELKVPVVCLSQLNRQAEDSKEHRPRLSHLRESGAIEQDADVVMFVHREEYYLRGEAKDAVAGQAQIIIEKQRNGPTGEVELSWVKDYTRFEDRAPDRFNEFDRSPA